VVAVPLKLIALVVLPAQIVWLTVDTVTVDTDTFTVLVAIAAEQPAEPAIVYVMVALPADVPVIRPLATSTRAMDGWVEDHVPPAIVDVKVVVPFKQISWGPLNIPAVEGLVIVTVIVPMSEIPEQPPLPVTV
jgi:hypothetical protein